MESRYDEIIQEDYTEVHPPLSYKLLLTYGVGHVLNDVCASMWFTYLLVFFHFVLQFDDWEAGCVLLIGQIADALATPFVGYFSDSHNNFWFCRYGKRKTWHLLGSICVLGAFPFIFSQCINCDTSSKSAQMFYFSMFVIIFQFGWAAVQISHLSLIPELTPNENDRVKLTAIRYSFTVCSNVLVYVVTWGILHRNSTDANAQIGPGDLDKFKSVVWICVTIGLITTATFHIFVHEDDDDADDNFRGAQLQTGIARFFKTFKLYQVAAVYMATRLFVNLNQVFIPLYLHETLKMAAESLAIIPLSMFLSSFITSFTVERLNKKCGRKLTYVIGALLGLIPCICTQLNSTPQYVSYGIYIIAILLGAGGSIILITSLSITADLIGTNTNNGAFVYGMMSFTDKLTNGIAVVIIQNLHKNSFTTYYRDILTYVCGGTAIFGSLIVLTISTRRTVERRITPETNVSRRQYGAINNLHDEIQPTLVS